MQSIYTRVAIRFAKLVFVLSVLLSPGFLLASAGVVITPDSGVLPAAQVGVAYSQTFSASMGTSTDSFIWSAQGNLPDGLSLSTTTGATTTLSGVPTTATTSNFSITATSISDATSTATNTYSLTV